MTNLDSILSKRDTTLPPKVHIIKMMIFPVVMYGCESWTINKAECWRIDAFELWCWRRLLRVPWTARKPVNPKGNQLNIHWKDWCRSWNANTLATWCEELTPWKRIWCWERLKAGGEGDDREQDGWVTSPTQRTWVWASSGSWWWTGKPGVLHAVHGATKFRHNWATELNWLSFLYSWIKSLIYQLLHTQSFLGFSDIFNILLLSHTLNSFSQFYCISLPPIKF